MHVRKQVPYSIEWKPITVLLNKLLEASAKRISELPNQSHSENDILEALHKFGLMLWGQATREIEEKVFRNEIGDNERSWQKSIVSLLAQEGLIFRNPGNDPYNLVLTPAYDALGGFIIAKSLLTANRNDRAFNWLKDSRTIELFIDKQGHALASDIFRSLVALAPTLTRTQLWKVAPEILKNPAIRLSTILDPKHLDGETVEALQSLFINNPKERLRLFSALLPIRAAANHPLNAEYLDKILRLMAPAGERDLSWTEWIRRHRDERLTDIIDLEKKWKSHPDRQSSDRLRLKWLMWHLTSTDHELRDVTTRALYWFGRGDPSALFDETIKSLGINDPYVPERMMAASYGVAMAHQGDFEHRSFTSRELPKLAKDIYDSIFSEKAPHRTTHILLREYAMRIVELARYHDSTRFTAEEAAKTTPPFQMANASEWGTKDGQENITETAPVPSPLRMDFENYTIGRLIPDRGNYDYEHEGYKTTKARVL